LPMPISLLQFVIIALFVTWRRFCWPILSAIVLPVPGAGTMRRLLDDGAEAHLQMRNAPAHLDPRLRVFHAIATTAAGLVDFYTHTGDIARRPIKWRPNHGVYLLAVSHYYDAQVYEPTGAWQEIHRPSAIGINVIGPRNGAPVAYRAAIDEEGVHLLQITFAVKVSHSYAPSLEGDIG